MMRLGVTVLFAALSSSRAGTKQRKLDENPDFEYNDLREYSVRFEKCQDVKMFDDNLAQDEASESPLAVKHFVLYRLCPSDSCGSCDTTYGQYVADAESYLGSTVEYRRREIEEACEECKETCNGNDDGQNGNAADADCSCMNDCDRFENAEGNGYVDAADYIECQQLNSGGDDDGDDNANAIYVGPMCSSSGTSITIGLFADQYCSVPLQDGSSAEELLGGTLIYDSFPQSDESGSCFSCRENLDDEQQANDDQAVENNNDDADANDRMDGDDVNQMCEELYDRAAKCESPTGLQGGFIQNDRQEGEEYDDYENQVRNEWMACNFITAIALDSYTEEGEINVDVPQEIVFRNVTKNQKLALGGLAFVFAALFGLLEFFRRRIERVGTKLSLHSNSASSNLI